MLSNLLTTKVDNVRTDEERARDRPKAGKKPKTIEDIVNAILQKTPVPTQGEQQ